MSSSKTSDMPWQVVGRGTQRDRLQNTQLPTRPAPTNPSLLRSQHVILSETNSRGLPRTQSALGTAANGCVPPNIPAHAKPASKKKKEDIPYEIKNAREWDPKRRRQADTSSESSDDGNNDDDDYDSHDSFHGEHPRMFRDASGTTTHVGFQPVVNKRSQSNARHHGQSSSHPKGYRHGKPPDQRQADPRVNLNYNEDNLARASFRKRLDPTGNFMLPKDCPEIEPNQKNMYDMFVEIGVRLGSFIRPPQHVKDREILLWGNPSQIQSTKVELQRWLDNRLLPRKSMAKDKFAREMSSIGDQYHRSTKKMQKEAKILGFQQVPAEGRIFSNTGTLLWEVDEVRPEDLLGPSLEALDAVRFQHHCHIVFDSKLSSFRIFTDKEESVRKTLARLEGTMIEYAAKSARPDMTILVEPPSPSAIRKDVKILPASLNQPKTEIFMIPVLTGSTLDPKARDEWLGKSKELTMKNNSHMERSLRKCIANLPHYRGLVQMRVLFGTFALSSFHWKEGADSAPFGEFMSDMTMSGTKGVMIRDLRIQKDAATIIAKVQKATDLFLPMNSSDTSLEAVVPSFSACFEFRDLDSPMRFMLEMSSSSAASTIYEKIQELWTRMDRRDNAVPLEAFMARLDGGASWELQVSNENNIDSSRINPKMMAFMKSVKLSKIPNTRIELTGQRVFTWEKDLPMQPSAFQQKTALRYRLAHQSEWEFEIARYDNYGDPKAENVPVETNWGASLYNTRWDSTLTANSTLGIGEAARWDPKLETFFPSPSRAGTADLEEVHGANPGVTEFFKNMEVVTKFIDGIKKELPHLGK